MKNKILAVIPARAGSKSVPDKNIREIAGKPMLAYSIEHALQSKLINRVIVSTDSEKYAKLARHYGAEVPFLRPAEYATDTALDYDVFYHALTWLKEQENYIPDVVVQLRPTYPIRRIADIDAMISMLLACPLADSVRSMTKASEIPYKMWLVAEQNQEGCQSEDNNILEQYGEENGQRICGRRIVPLMTDIPECYNMPRQQLPVAYYQNACIDVFRPEVVLEQHSMSGQYILGYEMTDNYDIDTEQDMIRAIQAMEER